MEEAARAHHNTTKKQAQSQIGFWLASRRALAMATQQIVFIHLIKDTVFGVAPRPPIGRSSKSTPQRNKKASPKPNWHLACFLAGHCHGHKKCPYSPDSRHLVWGCTRATNWCAFAASSNWWLWCHPKEGVLNQVNKDNFGWPWQGLAKKQAQSQCGIGLAFLLCIGVLVLLLPIGGSGATPEKVS